MTDLLARVEGEGDAGQRERGWLARVQHFAKEVGRWEGRMQRAAGREAGVVACLVRRAFGSLSYIAR